MEVNDALAAAACIARRALLGAGAAVLAGCATRRPPGQDDWHDFVLPGKKATRYRLVQKGGRVAFEAHSENSASMWRRRVAVAPERLVTVAFSWWVDELVPGANVALADHEDAAARVLFGFGGELSKLSPRTRLQFELAQALTGEAPPYATLMYVWDNQAPVDSIIVNPRTDRVRKIVADSGTQHLRRWRDHRRLLAADFERAFGERPGPLQSIALMTDTDNTRGSVRTWYGPVSLG